MRILEELFTTISEFRKYAPYAESNVTFDQLNSSAISAKKQMVIILTKDVYTELTADEGELKEALRLAMANLTRPNSSFLMLYPSVRMMSIYTSMSRIACAGRILRTIIMPWILSSNCLITVRPCPPGKKRDTRRCLMFLK